jgi:hypothetical protein
MFVFGGLVLKVLFQRANLRLLVIMKVLKGDETPLHDLVLLAGVKIFMSFTNKTKLTCLSCSVAPCSDCANIRRRGPDWIGVWGKTKGDSGLWGVPVRV